jgi:hypothetical protein
VTGLRVVYCRGWSQNLQKPLSVKSIHICVPDTRSCRKWRTGASVAHVAAVPAGAAGHYMKRTRSWPDRTEILPANQPAGLAPVRAVLAALNDGVKVTALKP